MTVQWAFEMTVALTENQRQPVHAIHSCRAAHVRADRRGVETTAHPRKEDVHRSLSLWGITK